MLSFETAKESKKQNQRISIQNVSFFIEYLIFKVRRAILWNTITKTNNRNNKTENFQRSLYYTKILYSSFKYFFPDKSNNWNLLKPSLVGV